MPRPASLGSRVQTYFNSFSSFSSEQLKTRLSPEYFEKGTSLKSTLSLFDLIGYGISLTVGAGIYVSIGRTLLDAGPAMLIAFIISGFCCTFSAFCYGEFAMRTKHAGSAYSFMYASFGELYAFFIGWLLNLEYAVSSAIVARYSATVIYGILESVIEDPPKWINGVGYGIFSVTPVPLPLIIICSILICCNTKLSVRVAAICTVINISVLAFISILAFTKFDPSNYTEFSPSGALGILKASSMAFFSFVGFDGVTILASESKKPERDMIISVITVLAIVLGIYLVFCISIIGITKPGTVDLSAPVSKAFIASGMSWGAHIVSAGSLFAIAIVTYSTLLAQPRIFYQMSLDGLLFKYLSKVDKRSVPMNACYLSIAVCIFSSCFLYLETLTDVFLSGVLVSFGSVCTASIIYLTQANDCEVIPETYGNHRSVEKIAARCSPWVVPICVLFYASTLLMAMVYTLTSGSLYFLLLLPIPVVTGLLICTLKPQKKPLALRKHSFPIVPLLGVIVNNIIAAPLICNQNIIWLIGYIILGFLIYIFYGHWHSILRNRSSGAALV